MIRYIPPFILHNFERGRLQGSFTGFALLFELSGTTQVSATVRKAGKRAAAELSLLLDEAFREPLGWVVRCGGFVTHFQGSAFTAVFPKSGPRYMVALVKALRHKYSQPTLLSNTFGSFDLKARLCLSYGDIEWNILANDLQHQYIFHGQALWDLEDLDELKQELALSPAALARTGGALSTQEEPVDGASLDLDGLPAKRLRYPFSPAAAGSFLHARLHSVKPENGFRDVVCCFARLNWPAPEQQAGLLNKLELIAVTFPLYVSGIVATRKGLLARAFFGIPYNDGDIMTLACSGALEAAKTIPGLALSLAAGRVYAGYVGSGEIREYTALGSTVKRAARLVESAQPGEIIVDAALQKKMAANYIFQPLPAKPEGKAGARTRLYKLTGAHTHGFTGFRGGFVGREAELAWLIKTIRASLAKAGGSIIYVQGDPGIGKTRLVQEALLSFGGSDCQQFSLACDMLLPRPLDPVKQLLRQALNLPGTESGEDPVAAFRLAWQSWAGSGSKLQGLEPAIASLLEIEWEGSNWPLLSPEIRLERQQEAWVGLLGELASRKPMLIHLDDIQWLDAPSLELFQVLGAADVPRICILAGSRYLENGVWADLRLAKFTIHRLNLRPLNYSGSVRLYKSLLGISRLPAATLAMIRTQSTGNPFFIEQYIAYMLESGRINARGEITFLEPEDNFTPADIIVYRVEQLTDKVRECVYNASVLGLKFNVRVLSQMLSSDARDTLANGTRNKIWKDLDEVFYIFSHVLIQEAVYNRMMGDKLQKLHLSAAEAMERVFELNLDEQAEEIAGHYQKAGELAKAAAYYDRAGGYYWDKCLFAKAEASSQTAIRLCAEACGRDNMEYGEMVFHLGILYHYLQRMEEAEKLYMELLPIATRAFGASDPRMSPYVNNLGRFYKDVGRFSESEKLLKRSLRMERKQAPDSSNVADRLNNLGHLYAKQEKYAQAEEMFLAAFHIMDEHYEPDHFFMGAVCNNLGGTYFQAGRYDEAEKMYLRTLGIANKRWGEEHPVTAIYLKNLGNLYFRQKRWQDAGTYYHKALNIYHKAFGSQHPNTLTVVGHLCNLYKETGDASALKVYSEWSNRESGAPAGARKIRKQKK